MFRGCNHFSDKPLNGSQFHRDSGCSAVHRPPQTQTDRHHIDQPNHSRSTHYLAICHQLRILGSYRYFEHLIKCPNAAHGWPAPGARTSSYSYIRFRTGTIWAATSLTGPGLAVPGRYNSPERSLDHSDGLSPPPRPMQKEFTKHGPGMIRQ